MDIIKITKRSRRVILFRPFYLRASISLHRMRGKQLSPLRSSWTIILHRKIIRATYNYESKFDCFLARICIVYCIVFN